MMGETGEAESLLARLAAEPPRDPRMCDLLAELLAERSDMIGALAWANAGVQLCLGLDPGPVDLGPEAPESLEESAGPRTGAPAQGSADRVRGLPSGDRAELRLLLSLRFRIRNDLGLPEDAYDRLLDELPSEPGSVAGLPAETTRASDAASRSTWTVSPSVTWPARRARAS